MDHECLFEQFRVNHPPQQQAIDGVVWEYIAAGQGVESLLLLPGALGVADTSFHFTLAFADRYRVLSLSYPPAIRGSTPLLAGIKTLLDREGMAQVHLVGGSYSGPVAHAFAHRYPARVRSIIFANTGLLQPNRRLMLYGLIALFALLPPPLLQMIMQRSIRQFLPADAPLEAFWRGYFLRLLPTITGEFLVNRVRVLCDLIDTQKQQAVAGWQGPVLMIATATDDFFTPCEWAELAAHYPLAQQMRVAEKGHNSTLNAVDVYIAAYRTFLQK